MGPSSSGSEGGEEGDRKGASFLAGDKSASFAKAFAKILDKPVKAKGAVGRAGRRHAASRP